MQIGQLRAFVATASLGSVTVAASSLGYSQSGVSRQISALETELGVTLFDRDAGRVRPTGAAAVLLPLVSELVALADRVGSTAGSYRIGA